MVGQGSQLTDLVIAGDELGGVHLSHQLIDELGFFGGQGFDGMLEAVQVGDFAGQDL